MRSDNTRAYLSQIAELERQIKQDQERANELRIAAEGVGAIRYDKDRVVTSPTNMMERDIIKAIELEEKIRKKMLDKAILKAKITEEIQELKGVKADVLYKRYVNGCDYKSIAKAINYEPETVRNLVSEAVSLFGIKHEKEINCFLGK